MSAHSTRVFMLLAGVVALAPSAANCQDPNPPPRSTYSVPVRSIDPAPPAEVATKLTSGEIENLVAPIALYPDVLLAQILAAATYPIDVVKAARWLQAKPDMTKVTEQPWDPSVLSLCHYPDIINKMNEDLDWMNALGAAFLDQQPDVMAVIQDLRSRAKASGALQTSPQQTIVIEQEIIRIVPAEEKIVYVPQYNPQVVYIDDDDDDDGDVVVAAAAASAVGFGAGLALGAWLDMDCDWHAHGVAYCRPGYWGGYPHRGAVAWGNDWAAAVGPRRAGVVGEHGGAYVGPRGAAVWGDNGRGAAWRRGATPYGRPAYGGRYSSYNRNSNVNVNRNNVNIDRGDRTNIRSGDRTNIGGDRTNIGGDRTNLGDRSAGSRTDGGGSAFGNSGRRSETRQSSDRGQRSREASGSRGSGQRPAAPAQRPAARPSPSRSSSGQSAFGGSGGSSRQSTRQSSSRGSSSRGGGSRGGGGRGGGRGGGGGRR